MIRYRHNKSIGILLFCCLLWSVELLPCQELTGRILPWEQEPDQRSELTASRLSKLQAAWRGKRGRQRAIDQKKMLIEMQRRERNALIIERVFRGHKGRERWEVHERLRERLEDLHGRGLWPKERVERKHIHLRGLPILPHS